MTFPNNLAQNPELSPINERPIFQLARRIALFTLIITIFASLAMIISGVTLTTWQPFVAAGLLGLLAIFAGWLAFQFPEQDYQRRMVLFVAFVSIFLIFFSSLIQNVNILAAIFCILFSIVIGSTILSGKSANQAITIGLVGGTVASLAGVFSPVTQITIPNILPFVLASLILLIAFYLYLLIRRQIQASLVIKLVSLVLALALIPLILLALLQAGFLRAAIQNQTTITLRLASEQVAAQVDNFITSNLDSITQEANLPSFGNYLSLPQLQREDSPLFTEITNVLSSLSSRSMSYQPSYGILNRNGINIYDTNPLLIGASEESNRYFSLPFTTGQSFVSPVEFSPLNNDPYIYFSAPIRNNLQQIIGVLRIRYDAHVLQDLLSSYVGLIGQRSFPILLDENNIRLADTLTPNLLYQTVAQSNPNFLIDLVSSGRLSRMSNTSLSSDLPTFLVAIENSNIEPYFQIELHPGNPGHEEIAYLSRLSSVPWILIYTEESATLQNLINNQNRISTIIASLFAGLVGVLGTIVSTILTHPIVSLNKTALQISSGDINAQAVVESRDEIGTLATSFNTMTGQLRGLISSLEARVAERTQSLAEQNEALMIRSRQLQTIAEVARGIVSMQDIKTLLDTLVRLISERFNFYHVGIFLIDEKNEYATLRSANSEGGQRMLARQHKLRVGQVGIVGYTAGRGEARIATDVGQDAVYFSNPDLPLTRSEMALPLQVGGSIIGVLDVQSTISNAFTQTDIELFSTLADQVAIAIYNNRLYQDALHALEDSRKVHRQYLRQEWSREISQREENSIRFSTDGISSVPPDELPEIQAVLATGRNIILSSADIRDQDNSVMAIPIRLRGETIGIIHVKDSRENRLEWSDEEVQVVQSVADQVGLALENARLLEQTLRRADRERKVLEITGRIRATTDPQEMLQIAAEEMQRVLNATRTQIVVQPMIGDNLSPSSDIEQSDDKSSETNAEEINS